MAGVPTDYLAGVPLFAGLSGGDLQQVAQAGDEIQAEAGRDLITEGRVGREFFLILDGEATVRRGGEEVARLGPGRYFGELSLLHRGPRSATVTAVTDMTLFVLGQREFAGLVDSVPGLAPQLLVGLAQRLREADAKTYTH
ncbi:MAG: cyclic nucleotide-binding domain-containing protein [Acidimicrobiia bacterium]